MGVCGSVRVAPSVTNSIEITVPPQVTVPSPLEEVKYWLSLKFKRGDQSQIIKPHEFEILPVPKQTHLKNLLDRVQGSLIGLAVGDALGAHVEFRPHQFLVEKPVTDFEAGGTWGLKKGQFTDDTSMALCLAASLISNGGFSAYDQLVRYRWWYRYGYMSSTGECFDIGAATRQSLEKFERRQKAFAKTYQIAIDEMDGLSNQSLLENFDVYCSNDEAAGNGGLMRLAPVPLFCHWIPKKAVEYSGMSARITHGSDKAYDACRFYGALIVAALRGESKEELLDRHFYEKHKDWFDNKPLHPDVQKITEGSYADKPNGYDDQIRGKGYVINSLEAALWAFKFDNDSFHDGVLAAVNLGDDTDTTAAIYGQLAGAHYGIHQIPREWFKNIYAKDFLLSISEWIVYQGQRWSQTDHYVSSKQESVWHESNDYHGTAKGFRKPRN